MELSPFLPLGQGLEIISASVCGEQVIVQVAATALCSSCPLCCRPATRVHSQYARRVADLPCAGQPVHLILRVRKFFCDTSDCPRRIFAERLTPFLAPWARMTSRLSQAIQAIGLATCGKLGSRLAARLGIQTSWMTVLHQIMATPSPPGSPVFKLGVDDFALRRGRTYGTILLDLDRRRVIDLLPNRKAETAAAWMEQHPTIGLVSRDRGGDYAAAARKGAPQAIQVADRFHLMQNLTDAVELVLLRCWTRKQPRTRQPRSPAHPPAAPEVAPSSASDAWRFHHASSEVQAHQTHLAVRAVEYEQICRLRAQGQSLAAIAAQMGKGTTTVWSWLERGNLPTGTHQRKRPSQLDAYVPYVLDRWQAGCHNGLQLWREIRERGYAGTARMLYVFLAPLRGPRGAPLVKALIQARKQELPTAREAVWLIVRDPAALEAEERKALVTLCQAYPTIDTLYPVVQAFRQLLHQRRGDCLDTWLEQARACHIKELQRFANGLERDRAAVIAGLTRQESNGPTEGFVNKLKLVKRTMYGRASFPLLRQRLLHSL